MVVVKSSQKRLSIYYLEWKRAELGERGNMGWEGSGGAEERFLEIWLNAANFRW